MSKPNYFRIKALSMTSATSLHWFWPNFWTSKVFISFAEQPNNLPIHWFSTSVTKDTVFLACNQETSLIHVFNHSLTQFYVLIQNQSTSKMFPLIATYYSPNSINMFFNRYPIVQAEPLLNCGEVFVLFCLVFTILNDFIYFVVSLDEKISTIIMN